LDRCEKGVTPCSSSYGEEDTQQRLSSEDRLDVAFLLLFLLISSLLAKLFWGKIYGIKRGYGKISEQV
jgi:hypothetical protein